MRQQIRWAVRHGLFSRALARQARAGEVTALLVRDPAHVADPFPHYETLRARGPLVDDGLVLSTVSHAATTTVLRSGDFGVVSTSDSRLPFALRLAAQAGGRGPLGPVSPPSMLAVDAPDHTRYRKLVARAFTAKAVGALRTRTQEIATELLDGLRGAGTTDLMADYASLLPATVIVEMLGAPLGMRRRFLEWGEGAALSLDGGLSPAEFRRSEAGLAALQGWMANHLDELRSRPGDDILSHLVHAHTDEGTLSADELISIATLVLAAGFETTVNLIGNGTALLTAHPDQLARLRAEPGLWPTAVEEILRFDSPVQRTGRVARCDTEVAGQAVAGGRIVVTLLGGANRDPAVFTDPQTFDVGRANAAEHVAFSSGIHHCLGAALARMEGEVGLRTLFARFPHLTPDGPPHRRPTRVLRGFDAMPVRLAARQVA